VQLGVAIETQEIKERIEILGKIPALTKFLSCEPLIEDIGEWNMGRGWDQAQETQTVNY
jgi:protein gp37